MSRIVSFRGQLADDAQERISLQTNNGLTGYRVVKFELMAATPHTNDQESVVKIYSIAQTATDAQVDFSDNTLLAAATLTNETDSRYYQPTTSVIFDNMTFNQDITVTHVDTHSGGKCNYYIELEQRELALDEATVATLKNIRNND